MSRASWLALFVVVLAVGGVVLWLRMPRQRVEAAPPRPFLDLDAADSTATNVTHGEAGSVDDVSRPPPDLPPPRLQFDLPG